MKIEKLLAHEAGHLLMYMKYTYLNNGKYKFNSGSITIKKARWNSLAYTTTYEHYLDKVGSILNGHLRGTRCIMTCLGGIVGEMAYFKLKNRSRAFITGYKARGTVVDAKQFRNTIRVTNNKFIHSYTENVPVSLFIQEVKRQLKQLDNVDKRMLRFIVNKLIKNHKNLDNVDIYTIKQDEYLFIYNHYKQLKNNDKKRRMETSNNDQCVMAG
jgi:hypothetical protein